MWSTQEQDPKLSAKQIRTFYSILQTAAEKNDPISAHYLNFVKSVVHSERSNGKVDKKELIEGIKAQLKHGLFSGRMDTKVVERIIQDIEQDGKLIKTMLEHHRKPDAKQDFLVKLEKERPASNGHDAERRQDIDSQRYHLVSQKTLLACRLKRGENLTQQGKLKKAIDVLSSAIIAGEKLKREIKQYQDKHSSELGFKYDEKQLTKVRHKLALVLNEYAIQRVSKPNIKPDKLKSAIMDLQCAIDVLDAIPNKTEEDLSRLKLIERNLTLIKSQVKTLEGEMKKREETDVKFSPQLFTTQNTVLKRAVPQGTPQQGAQITFSASNKSFPKFQKKENKSGTEDNPKKPSTKP